MDEQEVLNQIGELQKQRILLSKQVAALVSKINELKNKLASKNIKKGYYTDNKGLFCRVCNIKDSNVLVYELDTKEPPYLTKKIYYLEVFNETYCIECTKEKYNNALDKVVKHFKD